MLVKIFQPQFLVLTAVPLPKSSRGSVNTMRSPDDGVMCTRTTPNPFRFAPSHFSVVEGFRRGNMVDVMKWKALKEFALKG